MIKNIDHINIVVSNLENTKEFFLQLGFTEGDFSELEGEWISAIVGLDNVQAKYCTLSLPGSKTNLELIQYYSPKSNSDPNMGKANQLGYRHIAFEVDNIDEIVTSLQAKDVKFLSPIKTYPKTAKKLVYFFGPDGILLELAEYKKSENP